MDIRTLDYYKNNFANVFLKYNQGSGGIEQYFRISFPPNTSVLDIGAGSGRDLVALLNSGYNAYGVEPCEELRELAIQKNPELAGKLTKGCLPNLGQPFEGKFDGVLCSAVLMHVPKEHLFDSVFSIRNVLKTNGRLLLSVPAERPGLDEEQRDSDGRLFVLHNIEYLRLLFERLGFQLIGKWENDDSLGRACFTWTTLLFELRSTLLFRPIDQIEGILNRDRKVATYKLALFRAVCDIAMTNYQLAKWDDKGFVSIPLDAIVEKWIYYYWPIIESPKFLPQIYGETELGRNRITFRTPLIQLVKHYQNQGGLYSLTLDFRNSSFDQGTKILVSEVFKSIRKAIVYGPVTYAGGSLETGKVFKYDKNSKMVRMGADIWRELCLMGHWINDAIILRWAELTSDISKKSLKPSEVIDLLLTTPIPERDVYNVRQVYLENKVEDCVWSGKKLKGKFDVDHVIPFSLWRNNDLWNLLPADASVNRNKSDKLPTRSLLQKRKECIIHYWRLLKALNTNRFNYESARIVGVTQLPNRSWEKEMFVCMSEAVEVTALQRGIERWEPII